MILNNTRISIKNDMTTRISELASRKQVYLKTRDMRNIRKGESRKGASIRNRKRGTISSENTNRRNERAKSGQNKRIRSHMEGSSRIQIPRGRT
jgi:hypothetical protein